MGNCPRTIEAARVGKVVPLLIRGGTAGAAPTDPGERCGLAPRLSRNRCSGAPPPNPRSRPPRRRRTGIAAVGLVSFRGVGRRPVGLLSRNRCSGALPPNPRSRPPRRRRTGIAAVGLVSFRGVGRRPVGLLSRNRCSGALPPNPRSRPPRRRRTGIAAVGLVSFRGVGRRPVRLLLSHPGVGCADGARHGRLGAGMADVASRGSAWRRGFSDDLPQRKLVAGTLGSSRNPGRLAGEGVA